MFERRERSEEQQELWIMAGELPSAVTLQIGEDHRHFSKLGFDDAFDQSRIHVTSKSTSHMSAFPLMFGVFLAKADCQYEH